MTKPTCPRWRAERAALPPHTGKRELRARAAWHERTCPACLRLVLPGLPRDPDPEEAR